MAVVFECTVCFIFLMFLFLRWGIFLSCFSDASLNICASYMRTGPFSQCSQSCVLLDSAGLCAAGVRAFGFEAIGISQVR